MDALSPDVDAVDGDDGRDTPHQQERRLVNGCGGTICSVTGIEGASTSEIINRMGQRKACACWAMARPWGRWRAMGQHAQALLCPMRLMISVVDRPSTPGTMQMVPP